MKFITAISLAAGLLMTAACAHFEPALSPQAKTAPQTAILYGRFNIGNDFAFKNKLALWLKNEETGHPLYLFFDQDEPLYAVQVKPGNYQIMGFAALNRSHQIKHCQPLPQLQTRFSAGADSATYLGDFTGLVKWDSVMFIWGIKSCTNNFAATTAEFRAKYPRLNPAAPQPAFNEPTPLPEQPSLF